MWHNRHRERSVSICHHFSYFTKFVDNYFNYRKLFCVSKAFSSNEVMATKSRVTQLQEYQTILEEFWRSKRWLTNAVTFARDKQTICGISLQQINNFLTNCNALSDEELLFQIPTINLSSPTYESPVSSPPPHPTSRRPSRDDSTIDTNYFSKQLKINTSSSSYSLIDSLYFMNSDYKSETYCAKSYDDMRRCVSASKLINGSIVKNSMRGQGRALNHRTAQQFQFSDEFLKTKLGNNSNEWFECKEDSNKELDKTLFSDHLFRPIVLPNICETQDSFNPNNDSHNELSPCMPPNHSNELCDRSPVEMMTLLIRVYVAYECGLPFGTSVKLQITVKTTVKEIIELVVTHLNSLVEKRGLTAPIYHSQDFHKFCLIAIYSSNVKHLNEDFKIVDLQTPWDRAMICIKIKDNFSNRLSF